MNLFKCSISFIILVITGVAAAGQDSLRLTRTACETRFLEQNLLLLAEKLKISEADALVMQAKLWPNPSLTIDQVNLWATQRQLADGDHLSPVFGNVGRNQQIGVELEQLIRTAGKRKKMVALEQVSVDMSHAYFEELLRNLRVEFRNELTQLQYWQYYRNIYETQQASVQQLMTAFQKQVDEGNMPRADYVRLKALQLDLLQEIHNVNNEINTIGSELKVLMNLPATTNLVLDEKDWMPDVASIKAVQIGSLLDTVIANRPDMKLTKLEAQQAQQQYSYQRAQRVPDVTVKASYDRGGSFIKDFVGVGVAMDLPFFDRNQGNIKNARISMDRTKLLTTQKTLEVQSGVMLAYRNLQDALAFLEQTDPGFGDELDGLLQRYTKSFRERNINLLVYLDFLNAYLDNKKTMLNAVRDVHDRLETLQYEAGTDVSNNQ